MRPGWELEEWRAKLKPRRLILGLVVFLSSGPGGANDL